MTAGPWPLPRLRLFSLSARVVKKSSDRKKINGVSKGQGRTSLQGEVANTGIVRTVLHFADDAPQHFEQPDRSLRPTMATIHAIY